MEIITHACVAGLRDSSASSDHTKSTLQVWPISERSFGALHIDCVSYLQTIHVFGHLSLGIDLKC